MFVTLTFSRGTQRLDHWSRLCDSRCAEQRRVRCWLSCVHLLHVSGWTDGPGSGQCPRLHCQQLGGGFNSDVHSHTGRHKADCSCDKTAAGVGYVCELEPCQYWLLLFWPAWPSIISSVLSLTTQLDRPTFPSRALKWRIWQWATPSAATPIVGHLVSTPGRRIMARGSAVVMATRFLSLLWTPNCSSAKLRTVCLSCSSLRLETYLVDVSKHLICLWLTEPINK